LRNLTCISRLSVPNHRKIWGQLVSDEEPAREPDAERANVKLAQGLKACHDVVAGYRKMLGGEANDNGAGPPSEDEPLMFAAPQEPEEA
jgi:hypothetical protein